MNLATSARKILGRCQDASRRLTTRVASSRLAHENGGRSARAVSASFLLAAGVAAPVVHYCGNAESDSPILTGITRRDDLPSLRIRLTDGVDALRVRLDSAWGNSSERPVLEMVAANAGVFLLWRLAPGYWMLR